MQENYTKVSNIKHKRQLEYDRATWHQPMWHTCATSPIHGSGQETHPQTFSTIDPKLVLDQGLKMCITWIMEATMLYVSSQMDKGASYPHSTTPLEAPHQRRKDHLLVVGRPMVHFHQTNCWYFLTHIEIFHKRTEVPL